MSVLRFSRLLQIFVVLLAICYSSLPIHVSGADAAISQGFKTNETNLPAGTLVSQKPSSQNEVELANSDRAKELVGVVANQALIQLASGAQIQVVVSGITQVLVSDINGNIKAGDRITASPINGVGMKAVNSTQVIGIAQTDFIDSGASTQSILDQTGRSHAVKTGLIPVQVNVAYFAAPEAGGGASASYVPPALQSLANSFIGKNVSPLRVIAAGLILLLGFISITTLLYSSVRTGMASLGRNPLAGGTIRRGLAEVAMLDVGILVLTVIATYIILAI